MSRMKTFDVPHKGIRNALSQLSLLSGNTDFNDPAAVARLKTLGKKVFAILTIHAKDENSVTLRYLDARQAGASRHDREDHERIEQLQEDLENLLHGIEASEPFYSRFNDFHAEYLEHMAAEESITQGLLWQHFTDEELADHRREILAANPPETLLDWFHFVIPAQSHTERMQLLQGFKKMAPEPFFNKAMAVIAAVLSKEDYTKLAVELEI